MKTLYFADTNSWRGNVSLVDFKTETVYDFESISARCEINHMYVADEDMNVSYKENGQTIVKKAKKGDVIIWFHKRSWTKHPVVIIRNAEWIENMKEWKIEEAKNKAESQARFECSDCCDCATCCGC